MLRCFIFIFALLLFLTSCSSSTTVNKESDSTRNEDAEKTVKSLFDTTALQPMNTATFHTVEIRQMKFVPDTVRAHKGDTITWSNNDIVVHDITEEKNKEWTSSRLPIGKTWQMTADKSADYFCSIHIVMKGKIIVQ